MYCQFDSYFKTAKKSSENLIIEIEMLLEFQNKKNNEAMGSN